MWGPYGGFEPKMSRIGSNDDNFKSDDACAYFTNQGDFDDFTVITDPLFIKIVLSLNLKPLKSGKYKDPL